MLSRISSVISVALVFIALFVTGCGTTNSFRKEDSMVNYGVTPPLDTYVPTAMETATFSLG